MEYPNHDIEKDQNGPQKQSGKSRRIIKVTLLVVLAAVLLFAARLAYFAFIDPSGAFDATPRPNTPSTAPNSTDNAYVNPDINEPAITLIPKPTLSPEELLKQQADMEFMKDKVNILMLGWDQSPEREDEDSALHRDEENNYRSDVIILLTVDFKEKTADLISVPRDTYAKIYNTTGRWKINAAFAKGGSAEREGFTYAMNTISDLLGVPINYYAGVDMEGLKAVVDAMGGVYYDVDVEIHLNGRVLKKGYQHLNGQQVLDYCRARKGISTDVGRADRQQRMLFSIFEQLKDNGRLVDIPKIYSAVSDKLNTNLNIEQIAALSVFAMSLDMDNLNRHTLQGEYISNVYNASFYVLYNAQLKSLVKDVFGIDITPDPAYDAAYVRRDKRAAEAEAYINGAEHVLSLYSVSGANDVRSSIDHLRAAIANEDENAIQNARDNLRSVLYNYCIRNGITKQHVTRSHLPAEFYNLLPDYGAVPTPEPVPTAPPSSYWEPTPAPYWEDPEGPIIDDEPWDQTPAG